jgi:diguanylate cyclase (GGDEF)-like protein
VRHHFSPLSLRASLILVIVAPIAATFGLAWTTVTGNWSSRSEAVAARQATLELDSLLNARAAIADEYLSTAAIVYAATYHVSSAELDSLLGINFEAQLAAARRTVGQETVLRTTASLAVDYGELLSLRRAEAQGRVSFGEVQSVFGRFESAIDTCWLSSFDTLSHQADRSAPLAVRNSLTALGTAFTAFTYGLQAATFAQSLLTTPSTPAQVEGLIDANEQFETSVQGFPGHLGPRGSAAWKAFTRSPQVRQFNAAIQLAIQVGLRHEAPPYATNLKSHAGVFKGDVVRVTALTALVLAASADLRAVTAGQENSATNGLVTDLLVMLLLLEVALGGALVLSHWVGRPLGRIVSAAGAVREGEFDLPPLDESGPRELALAAAAFNEISSTLRAVEAHAVALAEDDLDHPVLSSPLPGRTGRALQTALDQLQASMRANEEQRDLLQKRATHDSLTGLLNRGAAVEFLERDLARGRRGGSALALLFIDVDGLKAINDTFGHEAGDAAITAVANALRATTRQSDVVARLGGDEFVVGWLEASDSPGGPRVAERIRQQVSHAVTEVGGHRIEVGCSIGIARSEPSDVTVDSLMNRADQALYLAKAEGREKVRWIGSASEQAGHSATRRGSERGGSSSPASSPVRGPSSGEPAVRPA